MRVFLRDVKRLFKAPAAVVVVLFLIVLPSLYTWFNVAGFWNPYDNTYQLRVDVANEDTGATLEGGVELKLGEQIESELAENTQLGWNFTDRETAMEEVQSGKAYAAFIIPSDFSSRLATLASGDFQAPTLEYYVNEKLGAVAPKITDTGATTLEQTINSTFVSTASGVVTTELDNKLESSKASLDESKNSAAAQLKKAEQSLIDSRSSLRELSEASKEASTATADIEDSLSSAQDDILLISDELEDFSVLTANVQSTLIPFTATLLSTLDTASVSASEAAAETNVSIGKATSAITSAQADVNAAIESGKAVADGTDAVIAELQTLYDSMGDGDPGKSQLGDAISELSSQNSELRESLDDLQTISDDTGAAADSIAKASDDVNTAVQATISSSSEYRKTLANTTIPALNSGLSQLSATASELSTVVSNQTILIDEAQTTLGQLQSTLDSTSAALESTDTLLGNLQDDISTMHTDVEALSTATALEDLFGEESFNPQKISDFMASPTEIETVQLYPLNAYGSAMAPLFINLTLWIGVFMLLVILKQSVDNEGIKDLKVWQGYLARLLFLAPLAALQAIVCCTGVLIMGVQTVNAALFYLTAITASLTYLVIQYTLSVLLQHLGKGLCIVLVFLQIPGATGLYPLEMMPPFFQSVHRVLPFTYGINALRETIAGFYSGIWEGCMGIMLVFLFITLALGLLLRSHTVNVNRMFARELRESDMFYGEETQIPQRRFRFAVLLQALSQQEETRTHIHASAERFLKLYPRLKRAALILGIAVPSLLTLVFSLNESEKVVVLTMWLIWLVFIMIFLIVIEHMRDSLERQNELFDLSEDEVSDLLSERGGVANVPSLHEALAKRRNGE